MTTNQNEIHNLNNLIKIPNNLSKLLKNDNYVLLIKGGAGTGKTTLALSILLSLNPKKRATYISSRVSPKKLFQYHNWLEKFFHVSKKMEHQDESEYVTNLAIFVDGRLYESPTLYERIANELMDTKQPVIIIDSIDAIESFIDKETLRNDAKILQTWCERSRAKLVITVEDLTDSTFDYMADGIVELKEEYFNGRKIRKIVLSKLRGIQIEKSSYFFTLNKGVFRSFEPYNPSDFEISFRPVFLTSENENIQEFFEESYFPTGYNELDSSLRGGFPRRRIIDLIINPNISPGVIIGLMSKIIASTTLANNPVIFQGFDKFDSVFLIKEIENTFPEATKKGLIKIFPPFSSPENITDITKLDSNYEFNKNHQEYIQNNILKMKNEFPEKILINIMGFDISDRFYNINKTTDIKKSFVEFIKTNTDMSLFVCRYLGIEKDITQKSDMCVRLVVIDDTLFFLSENPMSQLFAVVPGDYGSHNKIQLEPVV